MTLLRFLPLFALSVFWPIHAPAQPPAASENSLIDTSIADVHAGLKSGTLNCEGLVEFYLNRIRTYDDMMFLNSIQLINPDALDEARQLDQMHAAGGWGGRLHCVPVLLKDTFETQDMPTSFGSALFQGWNSGRDATVVKRLKDEGAIILAKTTMGEFGNKYYGSGFGIARNPYDPSRNPSGSSVGTAIGITANFGLVGIGEDSTGSIRGPAAVTNLIGLRPTHGTIDLTGMMPATPSADTLGPITRNSEDAALVLEVIIDDHRTLSPPQTLQDRTLRVGVINAPMSASTDTNSTDYQKVRRLIDQALDRLADHGVTAVEDTVPAHLENLRILEAKGFDSYEMEAAMDGYLQSTYEPPVSSLREILNSGLVAPRTENSMRTALGRSVSDPEYAEIQRQREQLREGILNLLTEQDLVALAYATYDHQTTIIPADVLTNTDVEDPFGKGDNRNLSPITGLPALTAPVGLTTDGLPVGLEFIAAPLDEPILLELARRLEEAVGGRSPPILTPEISAR